MERQKFEESLKNAFDQAEVSPVENVWTNIELDLERSEKTKMKRRLLFYQMLAAASVAFAMSLVGLGYYVYQYKTAATSQQQIAINEPLIENNSIGKADQTEMPVNDQRASSVDQRPSETTQPHVRTSPGASSNRASQAFASGSIRERESFTNETAHKVEDRKSQDASLSSQNISQSSGMNITDNGTANIAFGSREDATKEDRLNHERWAGDERQLAALTKTKKVALVFAEEANEVADPGELLLARLALQEQRAQEEHEKETGAHDERLWTSVGFAAGAFNAVNAGSSAGAASPVLASNSRAAMSTLSNESKASGVAYSFGVNLGGKVSERWVVQGGINYLAQNSDYTSNAVIADNVQSFKAVSSAEVNKLASEAQFSARTSKLVSTAPYNVNNSVQFLSIPVQAGYVLLNGAFSIQLNGGVSTDLFLRNTITPQDGNVEKVSQGRGEDSPYRPVNFSGLVGTEFSYRLADKYRIALNPGIRYPLNSIYKSNSGIESTPVTLDIGLRFKYIFQ